MRYEDSNVYATETVNEISKLSKRRWSGRAQTLWLNVK
jgi:hypothetical protein